MKWRLTFLPEAEEDFDKLDGSQKIIVRKALAKIKPTLISSLCKLFVMPAIFLPIAAMMGFRNEKMVAILIMLGAPTTVSCYIMSKNMGHEGVLSSSCVVSTTFLSSVFITLWLFLLRQYGLI